MTTDETGIIFPREPSVRLIAALQSASDEMAGDAWEIFDEGTVREFWAEFIRAYEQSAKEQEGRDS